VAVPIVWRPYRRHDEHSLGAGSLWLFDVVMRRYENRSTIMTSKWPMEEWASSSATSRPPGTSSPASCTMPRSFPMQGRSHRLQERTTPSHESVENAP
jgi:hypothetical protein